MKPALAVSLLLALSGPVQAAVEPAAAVCGQSRVLEAVQQRLSYAGQPATIEAGSVGQIPGKQPGTVYCALRFHTAVYDTARLGRAPADTVRTYQYTLQLRRNGIFLLP